MESAVVSVGLASEEPPLTANRLLTFRCRRYGYAVGTPNFGIWIGGQEKTPETNDTCNGSGAIVLLCTRLAKVGRILNATQDVLEFKKSSCLRAFQLEVVLASFCATHQEIDG